MNKFKKVTLITGVAGTTGSQILDYLVEEDPEIKSGERIILGIDNFFRGTPSNIAHHFIDTELGVTKDYFLFYEGNFEDLYDTTVSLLLYSEGSDGSDGFKKVVSKIDEIYHMAAIVPTYYFYNNPDMTYETNCKGTIDLFNWAVSQGVKRFIVGSSSEIYGHMNEDKLPYKELEPSNFDSVEDSTRWSYAEGKLLTEHYLNHFKDKMERVCHLRFANTYGVRDMDDNHVLPYIVNHVVNNIPMRLNKRPSVFRRTFLNNHDSARACVELMHKGKNGTAYNVGSTEEVSIQELFDLVTSTYEEMYGKKYSGEVKYEISRPGDPLRRVLCTNRLKEDTGFVPCVSLKDGVKDMIKQAVYNRDNGFYKP